MVYATTISSNNTGMRQIFQTLKTIPIGQTVYVTVISKSMEPVFSVGSSVKVIRSKIDTLENGEIIAFYIESMKAIIIHRITSIGFDVNGRFLTTRGDANNKDDPWIVRGEDFLGVVQRSV